LSILRCFRFATVECIVLEIGTRHQSGTPGLLVLLAESHADEASEARRAASAAGNLTKLAATTFHRSIDYTGCRMLP